MVTPLKLNTPDCLLGENPVWYRQTGEYLFTDILRGAIYAYSPKTGLSRTVLETPYYQFMSDGVNRYADVNLSYQYGVYLSNNEEQRQALLGALVTTLTGFVPGISGVRIRVNRRLLEQEDAAYSQERVYTGAQFSSVHGLAMTLYLPREDGRLKPVTRVVTVNRVTAEDLLSLLVDGPAASETELLSPYPDGFGMEDVLGVTVVDDVAVVNLTQAGVAALSTLSQEEERSVVYATVNTLTDLQGVRLVQFIAEDQTLRSFCGRIDLRQPLMRSPGLIQQTLD